MHKKLLPAAITATTLLLPLAGHAQTTQTFAGNGDHSFSGFLGLGSLTVSETAAGMITFAQTVGGPNGPSLDNNVSVFYIDSVAGGLTDTSSLTDTGGGNADHEAISGYDGTNRSVATFAPGFAADYAVAFQDGYLDLFSLSSSTPGQLTYLSGNGHTSGDPFTFTFAASAIGLTPTQGFNIEGALLSGAYRSNEAIGSLDGVTDPSAQIGYSPVTYGSFVTFAPAPEPSGVASLLIGAGALGGAIVVRRRRQTV